MLDAPRGEFVGPGGMQMLQAASMELAAETCSPFRGVNDVKASPPKLEGTVGRYEAVTPQLLT